MARSLRARAPWILVASLAIACLVVVAYAGFTSTAAFGPYTTTWEGTSELRAMADEGDRTATIARNASAYETVEPNETVAIVLAPDEPYGERDADRVAAFVEAGGTLLVADDRDGPANELLAGVNATARVDGDPLRDETEHGPSPAFPETAVVGEHPAVVGTETLVLNHGSAIVPGNGNASVQVESSPYGYLDRNRNEELDDAENLSRHPVMTVEPVGDGEAIVVSDASAFMNVMHEHGDNRQVLANVLGAHGAVLIDVSHDAALPPLALATLIVRESAAIQVLLLAGLFGGVWWLTRREVDPIARWRDRPDADVDRYEPSTEEVRAYLERRYPDWETERVDRVARAIVEDSPGHGGS